jgi:hypothetical protein
MEKVFSFGQGHVGIKQAVMKERNMIIRTNFIPSERHSADY